MSPSVQQAAENEATFRLADEDLAMRRPTIASFKEEAGFTVVEKAGEEGELVAQRDPRSASG